MSTHCYLGSIEPKIKSVLQGGICNAQALTTTYGQWSSISKMSIEVAFTSNFLVGVIFPIFIGHKHLTYIGVFAPLIVLLGFFIEFSSRSNKLIQFSSVSC